MTVAAALAAHPSPAAQQDLLAAAVAAALGCSQACTACADSCLSESDVTDMRRCISTDLTCADVCAMTARVLSRQTSPDADVVRAVLVACIAACTTCGEECAAHADHHEHCRVCAQACQECAQACRALLDVLA
ncbi:four-helix bundle copper-binding protein [Pseudokineococcus sp. 1T1Z-3]|uniref:four-helix bundle copper-binding protein n=1 Tax=Pseudokineococcus sp. 1T1Z-3 TaxID=3132745 RepID=UPI0030AE1DE6